MKFVAGMMVFHEQLGAGKLLKVNETNKTAEIAFLAYAQQVTLFWDSIKICRMNGKWEEVQKLFKESLG